MLKRLFDLLFASVLIFLLSPLLFWVAFLIYLEDKHSPIYQSIRIGKGGKKFRMLKFRTMVEGADKSGVDSTADNDPRITRNGSFLRRFKIDELPQLWNILKGEMTFVGPRPNVEKQVLKYTDREKVLLTAVPGVTDLASIYFSNEGEILAQSVDACEAYDFLIRPKKSELALYGIKKRSFLLDVFIIFCTVLSLISLRWAKFLIDLLRVGVPEQAGGPGNIVPQGHS